MRNQITSFSKWRSRRMMTPAHYLYEKQESLLFKGYKKKVFKLYSNLTEQQLKMAEINLRRLEWVISEPAWYKAHPGAPGLREGVHRERHRDTKQCLCWPWSAGQEEFISAIFRPKLRRSTGIHITSP